MTAQPVMVARSAPADHLSRDPLPPTADAPMSSDATTVQLTHLDPAAATPVRATPGALGYDLATTREAVIAPHETTIVPTGLQLAHDLPHDATRGLAMLILPRSSLPLKYGLILPNAPGLVDADYAGPIGIIVHNLHDAPVRLAQGTRIAQALFVEVRFPAIVVTDAPDPARTRGGFGSTG
jgi:dUTP diphosphatase